MSEVLWASAVAQGQMVKDGFLSAEELRAAVIENIQRLNPAINAVVIPLFDRPGSGVPMLLKDAGQELADTPHWVGVAALREAGAVSSTTTALAVKFEEAGFSFVGKGACPALSNGVTTEPIGFEPTRNPWDLSRSAGGSSGGPAAAVASGMVPIAHGSDATGSLRCPAALCGVTTLNPTSGRIPSVPPAGQPPNEVWRDFVLARHAEDLIAAFSVLAHDVRHPSSRELRVGLLDHDPELDLPVHPDCAEGVRVAGRLLEALGHHVEIGWPDGLNTLWARAAEPLNVVSDATRPPVIRWLEDRLGRPVAPDELDSRVFEAAGRASTRTADDLSRAQCALDAAVHPLAEWWGTFDLLVTPTTFQPAWPLGTDSGLIQMGTLLAPFSLSGQPALSLPLHRTPEKLPVGVQIVGRAGDDETLLALAEQLQAASDWTLLRPPACMGDGGG
jgi:amidase